MYHMIVIDVMQRLIPIVEKDNWPSRLFYISFILIAIIIPRI